MTATEFQQHVERYQDEALRQPVAITRNGRERLVMLSAGEYRRPKSRGREIFRAEDPSDEKVAQIARGRTDPRQDDLDAELKS